MSRLKSAKESVLNAFFSRAQPDRLFIDGKLVPPVNQPFHKVFFDCCFISLSSSKTMQN